MSDRGRAIAVIEDSRRTHVEWLTWQETTPDWRSQVKPESPGGPAHHRKAIEEYDLVLSVLRREEAAQAERDRAALEAIENQADGDRARAELIQEQRARRRAESERDRALGEGAGLMERLVWARKQLAIDDDWLFALGKPMDQVRSEEYKAEMEKVKSVLTASPLSKLSGEVLSELENCRQNRSCDWTGFEPLMDKMDALRSELAREGGK